jgi:hypothetical protein
MKLFSKTIAILLIIGLNYSSLFVIGETFAYYNDMEISTGNTYAAGVLDFSLTNTGIEEFIGVTLGEDIKFVSVLTKTTNSFDIQYQASAEKISGNDNFCNALKLEVFHSTASYDGLLLSFSTPTTTALGTWAFEVSLPSTATNVPHGAVCEIDFVFKGWQTDVINYNDSGFSDEERIRLRLTSRMIVLNEFLPNPDGIAYGFDFGNDSSDMPQGEWVELYNNSDIAQDLLGWYVKDELKTDINKIMITDSNTIPATTIIGGKSWLVIYMNKAVFNNNGDTVRLFDPSNNLIDSYTYDNHDYCELEPTPNDENSSTTSGSNCDDVPTNKSYARIPDGIGYWVDPVPTPGGSNSLEPVINIMNIASGNNVDLDDIDSENQEELWEENPVIGDNANSLSVNNNSSTEIIEEIDEDSSSQEDILECKYSNAFNAEVINNSDNSNDLNSIDALAHNDADNSEEISENITAGEEELVCSIENNDNQQENNQENSEDIIIQKNEILTEDNNDNNIDVNEPWNEFENEDETKDDSGEDNVNNIDENKSQESGIMNQEAGDEEEAEEETVKSDNIDNISDEPEEDYEKIGNPVLSEAEGSVLETRGNDYGDEKDEEINNIENNNEDIVEPESTPESEQKSEPESEQIFESEEIPIEPNPILE